MMNEKYEIEELAPWFVLTLTLIGGVLRALLLANKGFWLDETFSIWVSNHSLPEIMQWVGSIDQQPPLYYLVLHYWMEFNGDSANAVRMLSVLFSAGTIPMIYLIGKRISGVAVGLAAAALLTLSPFNIRYAQETRMYAFLMFNAAVAIYALVRLLTDSRSDRPIGSQFREYLHIWRTPGPVEEDTGESFSYKDVRRYQTGWRAWIYRHRWSPIQTIETDLAWITFIVFSAATMLSHNTAILFPLATNIFGLGLMFFQWLKKPEPPPAFQAPSFWNWVKAQIGIFVLWGPWIFAFTNPLRRAAPEFWIPEQGWETVIQTIKTFLNESLPGSASHAQVIWILYAVVICFGLVHFRKKISQLIFLAALFAIPLLIMLIVRNEQPDSLDRSLFWATIPLFLVLAAGIAQLRYRLLIFVVLGIFSIYNMFSTGDYYRFVQKEDWSNPAGFVANFVRNDDLILFNASRVQIPFDYYFKHWEEQYSLKVEKHGVPVDMFDSGVYESIMTESDVSRLKALLSGHTRVFLINSHNSNTDPMGLIPQTLAAQMQLVLTRDYNGVQIQWYEAP